MKGVMFIAAVLVTLFVSACMGEQKPKAYRQITQEEAAMMMGKNDGHVVIDVRRKDEFDAGHIPGALLLPNETIGTEKPDALPDLTQIILVYCRSGNRSKQAAQKLADMGYENVCEFGGIIDWKGETVKETEGRAGEVMPVLVIEANGRRLHAHLEDNSSARALAEKLSAGPIEVDARDYGHFEKVGSLPWTLPRNDERITTAPGDVILYEGDQITVYYDTNTWNFTRIAKIGNTTREQLLETLGEGNVTLRFWVEWSE